MTQVNLAAAMAAVESDEERERERAIPVLVASARPEALVALEKVAEGDDNLQIRFLAKEGARKLRTALTGGKDAEAGKASRGPVDLKKLESRLTDKDPARRLRGVRSALAHRDRKAVPMLAQVLGAETDPIVAAEICLVLGALGDKAAGGPLMAKLSDKSSAEVRLAAVKGLAALKDPAVYPTIVAMLQDPDREVKAKAMELLLRLGKPRLVRLFVRMLGSSRSWPRKAAVRACAKIHSAEFVEVLLLARAKDPDPALRREATKALVHLRKKGNKAAAAALDKAPPVELEAAAPGTEGLVIDRADQGAAKAGANDEQIAALKAEVEKAKAEAAKAQAEARKIAEMAKAGRLPAQGAISQPPGKAGPAAVPAPATPGSPGSVSSSVSATLPQPPLEILERESEVPSAEGEELELSTAEVMVGGLSDPSPEVRLKNVTEILVQKDRELAAQLAARLPLEDDPKVLAKLLLAVGKLGRKKDARRIQKFLDHKDARIRANAVEALAMLGDEEALRAVVPLLTDDDNRTRGNAVVALKDVPDCGVMETLKEMAKHRDPQMRLSAIYAALEIGRTEVDPVLHHLLRDAEQEVKEKALSALNLLEDQRMAPMTTPGVDLDSTQAHLAKLSAWRGGGAADDDSEDGGDKDGKEDPDRSKSIEEEAEKIIGKLSADKPGPPGAAGPGSGGADKERKDGAAAWGRTPTRAAPTGANKVDDPATSSGGIAGAWQGFMKKLTTFEGDQGKPGAGDADRRQVLVFAGVGAVLAVLVYFFLFAGGDDDMGGDDGGAF